MITDGGAAGGQSEVLLSEDFDDVHDPDDSDAITRDGRWDVQNDALRTDGHNGGVLETATVQADGDASFSFDASTDCAANFEATGHFADSLMLQAYYTTVGWFRGPGHDLQTDSYR
jgi:hypothetical protein